MEAANYSVEFAPFCKRHYIKSFEKKYGQAWLKTRQTIEDVCQRIDAMLQYNRADLIATSNQFKLVKLDFSIEGSRISPKSSGNRCILCIDVQLRKVKILLVYSKNDISPPNETSKWKQIIKKNFQEVADIFSL